MLGAAEKMHPSGGVLDTEEHINPFQEHGIDVQKVDSENALSLGGEELPVAEAEEFSGDALVSPVRIFAGQL